MSVPAIQVENLSKYKAKRPIINDLNFNVRQGEVYALVGPNGAGKTTVIRLVCGLMYPTSGTVKMFDQDPLKEPEVRRRLGAVVEAPAAFYPYLTGRKNLRLYGQLSGGVDEARISKVLQMVELENAADRKVRAYSLGMRQRLGVAAAMLSKPDILILDEPASGMDPLSLHLVHRVLREAASNGAAVLLSTHHLNEVVAYCTRVAILEEGVLIDEVNLTNRRLRFRATVTDASKAVVTLKIQPYISHVSGRGQDVVFILSDASQLGEVSLQLAQAGVGIKEMVQDTFDLAAYYRERVQHQRRIEPVEPKEVRRAS